MWTCKYSCQICPYTYSIMHVFHESWYITRLDVVCAFSSSTVRMDHMWQLCHHMWQSWQWGRDRAVWLMLNMILKPTLQFRAAETSLKCYVKLKTFLNLLNLQVDTNIIPESEGKFLFASITSNEQHDNDKRRKCSLMLGVQIKNSNIVVEMSSTWEACTKEKLIYLYLFSKCTC